MTSVLLPRAVLDCGDEPPGRLVFRRDGTVLLGTARALRREAGLPPGRWVIEFREMTTGKLQARWPSPRGMPRKLIFSPDQRRRRLFAVVLDWIFSASTEEPLVLVVEDEPQRQRFLRASLICA